MNLVSTLLTSKITASSSNRFSQTSANLKVNGILIDVSFKVPEDKAGTFKFDWDFLKEIFVTVPLRLGNGNGSAVQLISACSIYQLLAYSDFKAGVSMKSTDFVAGKVARISGYLPVGYFEMNARDALECSVNVANKPTYINEEDEVKNLDVDFVISAVYKFTDVPQLITYDSAEPTGADQPYTNVLELFYDGENVLNKEATITDQEGPQSVNIEDAIALSNAIGNFEFFTRSGLLYSEPHGISQNLSFKIPVDVNGSQDVLIVGMAFYPELLVNNSQDAQATRKALISKIETSDKDKYTYLKLLGRV